MGISAKYHGLVSLEVGRRAPGYGHSHGAQILRVDRNLRGEVARGQSRDRASSLLNDFVDETDRGRVRPQSCSCLDLCPNRLDLCLELDCPDQRVHNMWKTTLVSARTWMAGIPESLSWHESGKLTAPCQHKGGHREWKGHFDRQAGNRGPVETIPAGHRPVHDTIVERDARHDLDHGLGPMCRSHVQKIQHHDPGVLD
jgi:hypothetical protein